MLNNNGDLEKETPLKTPFINMNIFPILSSVYAGWFCFKRGIINHRVFIFISVKRKAIKYRNS
jgi:hypothetical protein